MSEVTREQIDHAILATVTGVSRDLHDEAQRAIRTLSTDTTGGKG